MSSKTRTTFVKNGYKTSLRGKSGSIGGDMMYDETTVAMDGEMVGQRTVTTTTVVTRRARDEISLAREYHWGKWMFGKGAKGMEYLRLIVMTIFFSVVTSFFTGMLRAFSTNAITLALGVGFLRFAITCLTYSEQKGLLDPVLVIAATWSGRITIKFAVVMFFSLIGGSAVGFAMVHAFNPNQSIFPNDGAPLIGAAYTSYVGLALTWEFLASFLVYSTVLWSYGLLKIECWIKRDLKEFWMREKAAKSGAMKQSMEHHLWGSASWMGAPRKLGCALIIGFAYGVATISGYQITGSSIDIFYFVWPATFSGLLTAGYPNWWIYLVGPFIGLVATCLFWSIALRLISATTERKIEKWMESVTLKEAKNSGEITETVTVKNQ